MVLYSFMINKSKIEYAFSVKDFKDERHKINYMMVIVSNSMNDIKNKVVALQNLKEKNNDDINNAEYLNRNNVLHGSQKYVKKTVQKQGCVYLLRAVARAPVGNRRKTAKSAFVNQTLLKIRHKKAAANRSRRAAAFGEFMLWERRMRRNRWRSCQASGARTYGRAGKGPSRCQAVCNQNGRARPSPC